jgi:hypothetical protein
MADCEKLRSCPFFRDELAYMPRTAALMKETYCRGDKSTCARYVVALKGIPVPGDLFFRTSVIELTGSLPTLP